jgi:uncharacterized protein YkwD
MGVASCWKTARMAPALLRLGALLSLVALAGCSLLPLDLLGPATPLSVSTREAGEAARVISDYRRSRGLGPVVVDSQLNAAAVEQASAIARAGTLSHGDFASRMAKYDVSAASENLAMGSSTVAGTMQQWRESRPHKANLLKEGMTRIGFARAQTEGRRRNNFWALVLAR